MPEGHTLHRLARLHQRRYAGAPVAVSSPQGRFAAGASAVDGRTLQRATAWGKHLFHHYVDGSTVHVHLGLYGTFTEWPRPPDAAVPAPVGQVRMRMVGAEYGTDLRGPTVCEVIDEAADFNSYKVLVAPAYQLIDEELVRKWTRYAEAVFKGLQTA